MLVVAAGRRAPAGDQIRSRRVEAQLATGFEDAGAKLDRRQMPFADGAQAHHDALLADRQVRLIGREHDRRIEERSGFDRVLVREVRADQAAPVGRTRSTPGAMLCATSSK